MLRSSLSVEPIETDGLYLYRVGIILPAERLEVVRCAANQRAFLTLRVPVRAMLRSSLSAGYNLLYGYSLQPVGVFFTGGET